MARDPRRLNWGSGPVVAPGWWNSDSVDYGQEHVGSIADGLPCRAGFFDAVVANHSLQCLPYDLLEYAAFEFHRVLVPGGVLRVLVPDVVAAFRAHARGDESWPGFVAISEPWGIDRKFAHYLTWGGSNRSTFTASTLKDLLGRHGFTRLNFEPAPGSAVLSLDSRLDESLVVTAIA